MGAVDRTVVSEEDAKAQIVADFGPTREWKLVCDVAAGGKTFRRGDAVTGQLDRSWNIQAGASSVPLHACVPASKELSVIVPIFNEVDNIRPLTERLFKALKSSDLDYAKCELLFVDDKSKGSDSSAAVVEKLAKEGYAVRFLARSPETHGPPSLSRAVMHGFRAARHWTVLCMDGDLQHEPEAVPNVCAPVVIGKSQMSFGSRFVEGGGVGFEWAAIRVKISQGAALLAYPVAPKLSDPTAGFFCCTKAVLVEPWCAHLPHADDCGFKIGLEIYVQCKRIARADRPFANQDVGIVFRDREAGASKMSNRAVKAYAWQVLRLYWEMVGVYLLALLFVAAVLLLRR